MANNPAFAARGEDLWRDPGPFLAEWAALLQYRNDSVRTIHNAGGSRHGHGDPAPQL